MQFSSSDEAVENLRGLMEQEIGDPVSQEDARVAAGQLVELYDTLSRIARQLPPETKASLGLVDLAFE